MNNFLNIASLRSSDQLVPTGFMREIEITASSDRRVVGTMNEFGFEASIYREDMSATDLAKLSMRLAETPCGAIGYNSPDRLMLDVVSRTHH